MADATGFVGSGSGFEVMMEAGRRASQRTGGKQRPRRARAGGRGRSTPISPGSARAIADKMDKFRKLPPNRFCADCMTKEPQWCSISLGVIICDKCAGIHRSLGTHVSVVKSLEYDTWTSDMLSALTASGGNGAVNACLQKFVMTYETINVKSTAEERTKFISLKYVKKEFSAPRSGSTQEEAARRLVHYFLAIGRKGLVLLPPKDDSEKKARLRLSKSPTSTSSTMSSSRYLPVPRTLCDVELEFCLRYRYPASDHAEVSIPARVWDFIFVDASDLKLSKSAREPEHCGFVLTDEYGNKQFGCALIFWERLSPMDIISLNKDLSDYRQSHFDLHAISDLPAALYAPVAIALISHWPFFNTFSEWLQTLYRVSKTPRSPIPVERYVANFMYEVPVPPSGKIRVRCVIGDKSLTIKRHPPNSLPFCNVNGLNLFRVLDPYKVVVLFQALLLEYKIVFVSKHQSLLLDMCETLHTLMYPFTYQGVYMPVLPSKLVDFLHSPVPYLAGVKPGLVDLSMFDDIVVINCDGEASITGPSDMLTLPKRFKDKLEKGLYELIPWHSGADSKTRHSGKKRIHKKKHHASVDSRFRTISPGIELTPELFPISRFLTGGATMTSDYKSPEADSVEEELLRELQRLFLKFFTGSLEDYHTFMYKNEESGYFEFDTDKFMEEKCEKTMRPFMRGLCQTQMFQSFIQERAEFLERDPKSIPDNVRYFDEELIAKKNRSVFATKQVTPFLDDRSMDLTGMFVANPPSFSDARGTTFSYETFPRALRSELFGKVRPVKAEWEITKKSKRQQRQALEAKKAISELIAMEQDKHLDEVKGWDHFAVGVLFVQSYLRGVYERRIFLQRRKAVKRLQNDYRMQLATRNSRAVFLEKIEAATVLQACVRSFLGVQKVRSLLFSKSTVCIQAAVKAYFAANAFRKLQKCTLRLQATITARRKQVSALRSLKYVRVIQCVSRTQSARAEYLDSVKHIELCQAAMRGTLIRARQHDFIRSSIQEFREEITKLWTLTFTSLNYRAKFWMVFMEATYLHLAIHEEELERLRKLDKEFRASPPRMAAASERFEAERSALYALAKERCPQSVLDSLFSDFEISKKAKHRKAQLLSKFYAEDVDAYKSASAVLAICGSTPGSVLDVTAQVELRRSERIRKNLMYTVLSSMSSLQSLNSIVSAQERKMRRQKLRISALKDELKPFVSHRHRPKHGFVVTQSTADVFGRGKRNSIIDSPLHMLLMPKPAPIGIKSTDIEIEMTMSDTTLEMIVSTPKTPSDDSSAGVL